MNEQAIKIYNELQNIVDQPLYLVGGSIRDLIRGVEPKDYDFAVPITPEKIEARVILSGKKAYTVGKRFGTIGVKIQEQLVEVTTFRSETYSGSRKPKVEYVTDIIQDLSRRDFTINAIASREGKLIDPFKGVDDINNKVIRAVGNPRERFREDPLRMLRAIRFATSFGYIIEENTMKKLVEQSYKILGISKERWMQELDKILLSDNVLYGLTLLRISRLLNFMIPEIALQFGYDQNSPHHKLNLWEHTCMVVNSVPKDINMRWAALLHDIGKPFTREEKPGRSTYIKHDLLGAEMVERLARHLKWSNERREAVKELVFSHMADDSALREFDKNPVNRGFKDEQVV